MEKDLEIALCLIDHIMNPCIEPITGKNIRPFYLKLAREILDKDMYESNAKSMLENVVNIYSR